MENLVIRKAALFITTVLFTTSTALTASNIFVNNTNPMSGTGTFANPYNTLAAAQLASGPGDVIFVFVGDGTSNGMNAGFVLKDNQKLIGSGLPLITNTSGNGIELANNNVVSGLHIDSTAGWGIHGTGIAATSLTGNLVTNPLSQGGIGIFDSTKQIQIENSTIQNGGGSINGIDIENHGTTIATVTVQDNIVTNFLEGIVIFGFDSSTVTSHVLNNDVSTTTSAGIDVDAFDLSNSTTTIKNNTVHDNAQNGIITFSGVATINPSQAILHATIQSNIITNCGLEGLVIATGNKGQQVAFVTQNQLSGNGGVSGVIAETSLTATPGDKLCLRLNHNTSSTGFFLQNFTGNTFNLETPVGNVGTLTTSGTITPEPAGFCH
jgi:hypothetical protein